VLLVDRAGEGHGEAVGCVHYDGRRYTKAMTFRIVLEYDAEARAFSAVCPELPGCASAGDTEEEARRNIKEAIELYLEPSDIELPQDAKISEVTVG
jgi:predicted RNase H-like HicB family nuclease